MNINIINDTNPNSPHRLILDLIPYGSRNARSMHELAQTLNVDDRVVRNLIEKARVAGNIIAGTNAGIFIPESTEELREYTSRTFSRIDTSIRTLEPALNYMGGSINLTVREQDHE